MMPAAFFRALLHMLKRLPGVESAGSCLAVRLPQRPDLGTSGTLFLSDCAMIPTPSVAQLAMHVEAVRLTFDDGRHDAKKKDYIEVEF